jgi:CHASE2 domain-containing sensor protein
MLSVLNGAIDDGWNGVLGWFWLACAASTGVLASFTRAALRERSYSAVMAATGLSYLAILTGFGTDLIARALLMA